MSMLDPVVVVAVVVTVRLAFSALMTFSRDRVRARVMVEAVRSSAGQCEIEDRGAGGGVLSVRMGAASSHGAVSGAGR